MRLVTASLSLGRRFPIIARVSDGELLSNVTDVDYMTEANRFTKEWFGPAREDEVQIFNEALGDAPSGTVVRVTKCDGFKRRYVKAFEKELGRHLGRVYRMFIRAGRRLYVNGVETDRSKNHRLSIEVISHGVWLYYWFCLSYRDKEMLVVAG